MNRRISLDVPPFKAGDWMRSLHYGRDDSVFGRDGSVFGRDDSVLGRDELCLESTNQTVFSV